MKKLLYHLATLPPRLPGAEAVTQDLTALRGRFGGEIIYVNPNQPFSRPLIPRLLFGFHRLPELRRQDAALHQVYNPDPFPFPYLRLLRQPVIYVLTCGLGSKRPNLAFFASLRLVAASDRRSLDRLRQWGLTNTALVRPGIDLSHFSFTPAPLEREIRLMVGSAPWTKAQFRSKGVDALLAAARREPALRLVFLWRRVLAGEMAARIQSFGVEKQVAILDRRVDVNKVLAGVHAAVTLAGNPAIVKSYPNSLLESLAAGKPVLVSRQIPLADDVAQTGCGQVVDSVTPENVLDAVEALRQRYPEAQAAARATGRHFSLENMLNSFEQLYQRIFDSKETKAHG